MNGEASIKPLTRSSVGFCTPPRPYGNINQGEVIQISNSEARLVRRLIGFHTANQQAWIRLVYVTLIYIASISNTGQERRK